MVSPGAIAITLGLISSFFISTHGVDNTDEKRPYEFGFNIEGEQHRHEKKDERGLIMGEFGFITADGVYHVTVYATDEEGRFKILSMKNIRVKPYPTYKQPSGLARQGHSLDVADPQKALSQQTSPSQNPDTPFKKITIEKPARSCSSCSLPTTTTQAPAPAIGQPNIQNTPFLPNQQNFPANQQNFPANQQNFPANQQNFPTNQQSFPANQQNFPANQQSFPANQQNFPANQQSFPANQQNFPANQQSFPANQQNFPANQQNNFNNPQSYNQQIPSISQNVPAGSQNSVPQAPDQGLVAPKQELPLYPPLDSPQNYPQGQQSPVSNNPAQPSYISQNPETLQNNPFGNNAAPQPNSNTGRTAKKLDNVPQLNSVGALPNRAFNQNQEIPNKPTLISAQMQIVDKNTDIHKRGPGEKEGLPEGLTKNDMSQLLYTFNYTVGFHGHFEEGYRNGAKQGYYFVTGRNGVRTRVDYVADDKGFKPKITQEVLDLISEEVPKPETEKDEKYGLKGYEFKWLYFPADPKGR